MGSQQPSSAAPAPQQELPPVETRNAACPYFSFTTSLSSMVVLRSSAIPQHGHSSAAQAHNRPRFHCLVAGAAFGIQETQQFLKRFRIRRIPQIRALSAHLNEVFVFQFVEVVREGGWRDGE